MVRSDHDTSQRIVARAGSPDKVDVPHGVATMWADGGSRINEGIGAGLSICWRMADGDAGVQENATSNQLGSNSTSHLPPCPARNEAQIRVGTFRSKTRRSREKRPSRVSKST